MNRDTLVCVLLLIDASVPPQKIDLDCANWLGRNNVCWLFGFVVFSEMMLGGVVNFRFDYFRYR